MQISGAAAHWLLTARLIFVTCEIWWECWPHSCTWSKPCPQYRMYLYRGLVKYGQNKICLKFSSTVFLVDHTVAFTISPLESPLGTLTVPGPHFENRCCVWKWQRNCTVYYTPRQFTGHVSKANISIISTVWHIWWMFFTVDEESVIIEGFFLVTCLHDAVTTVSHPQGGNVSTSISQHLTVCEDSVSFSKKKFWGSSVPSHYTSPHENLGQQQI